MSGTHCMNCGVALSETPEERDMHPVQARHLDEDGEAYCAACFFGGSGAEESEGEYEHTGEQIARASEVNETDEELAELLAETLQAEELRKWMSAHGLERSRGARKKESAEQAVSQDRVLVAAALEKEHGLAESGGDYAASCSCGFEEWFGDGDAAAEAASEHKSENPRHFPKAWAPDGRRLYG